MEKEETKLHEKRAQLQSKPSHADSTYLQQQTRNTHQPQFTVALLLPMPRKLSLLFLLMFLATAMPCDRAVVDAADKKVDHGSKKSASIPSNNACALESTKLKRCHQHPQTSEVRFLEIHCESLGFGTRPVRDVEMREQSTKVRSVDLH